MLTRNQMSMQIFSHHWQPKTVRLNICTKVPVHIQMRSLISKSYVVDYLIFKMCSLQLLFHQTDDDDYENSDFLEQGVQDQKQEQEQGDDGECGIYNISYFW